MQPRVLNRTVNIERGIVRVEEGRAAVVPLPAKASGGRATSISEERLYEALAEVDPSLPERLRNFADRLSENGVTIEPATKSLVLRWIGESGLRINLVAIKPNGEVLTDCSNWPVDQLGRIDIGHAYQAALAELIGGDVRKTPQPVNCYVRTAKKARPLVSDLLDHADGWVAAIEAFIEAIREANIESESRT